ncbi:MAG: GNAT family N-acetyltransferase [Spirochaetaceae bacterium]|jgi:ribosomal protein S18 acetylase RimI-like enzyme|nr:GNAT family N-acetyltransferase [Spirochaetaceae bacterium]
MFWKKCRRITERECSAFMQAMTSTHINAAMEYQYITQNREFFSKDGIWLLRADKTDEFYDKYRDKPIALLVGRRRTLFPIFAHTHPDPAFFPKPAFIDIFLRRQGLHGIQGLKHEALWIENLLARQGMEPVASTDYNLMIFNPSFLPNLKAKADEAKKKNGNTVLVREAGLKDADTLLPLEAAYEKAEVLLPGEELSMIACKNNLNNKLQSETVFGLWLNGKIAAKLHTNARAGNYVQIGGIYVLPEYRRHGLASCLLSAISSKFIAEGRQVSLFVKKKNAPALSLYLRSGFIGNGDYRITYY